MSGRNQIWICLLALAVAALSMLPLEIQRRVIDDALQSADFELLAKLIVAHLLVLLVHGATKYALRMYQGWLSESAIRYTRGHLARIYGTRKERKEAEEDADGRVASIVGTEADKLGGFVGEGISQPFVNLGMLVAIVGYMLTVDPAVVLFSSLFLIPQIAAVPLLQRWINALVEKRVALVRNLSDDLVALSDAADDGAMKELPERLDGIYTNRMRTFFLTFGLKALINFFNGLAPLSVLAVGGYFVIRGETTVGVVVAFISGFDRLASPLRELTTHYRVAAQANVQHRMIADWIRRGLNEEPSATVRPKGDG